MSSDQRDYVVVSRYFESDGWKRVELRLERVTYEAAGREASRCARALDERFADDHFWTVDLMGAKSDGHATDGSFFQLFHGRLS